MKKAIKEATVSAIAWGLRMRAERKDMPRLREYIVAPNCFISIQANEFAYCSPRESGLLPDQYTHVEVGLLAQDLEAKDGLASNERGFIVFLMPSECGADPKFDAFFEEGGPAPYMEREVVAEMVAELMEAERKEDAKR